MAYMSRYKNAGLIGYENVATEIAENRLFPSVYTV